MAKPNRICYGRTPCLHIGTCVDFWADDGMCLCNPVDAAHYPGGSGSVCAGVNKTGSNANLRIFENGVEVYRYNIPSSYDYGWVCWSWSGGYHADMEFAFYNGDTKRWSRTCMVGDMPPASGEIVSIDVPAAASEGDGVNLCATIKNTGGTTAKFFLRFYDGSTKVRETLPGNVAPGQTITDICEYFTMPGHAWSGKIELMRQT